MIFLKRRRRRYVACDLCVPNQLTFWSLGLKSTAANAYTSPRAHLNTIKKTLWVDELRHEGWGRREVFFFFKIYSNRTTHSRHQRELSFSAQPNRRFPNHRSEHPFSHSPFLVHFSIFGRTTNTQPLWHSNTLRLPQDLLTQRKKSLHLTQQHHTEQQQQQNNTLFIRSHNVKQ